MQWRRRGDHGLGAAPGSAFRNLRGQPGQQETVCKGGVGIIACMKEALGESFVWSHFRRIIGDPQCVVVIESSGGFRLVNRSADSITRDNLLGLLDVRELSHNLEEILPQPAWCNTNAAQFLAQASSARTHL